MRLPSARAAVGIYVALLALATIPQLTQYFYEDHYVARMAITVPTLLLPASLFIAAFAIDDRWAFGVPVVALIAQALVTHYFGYDTRFAGAPEFEQITLRHDLWEAIKGPMPVALIVVAVAYGTSWWWLPWVSEDRIEKPNLNLLVVGFAVALGAMIVLDAISMNTGFFNGYIFMQLQILAFEATAILFFLVCAVGYSVWVLPIPLFVVSAYAVIQATSRDCRHDLCHGILWPLARDTFILWTSVMLIALAAGWWSRRGAEAPAAPAAA